MSFAQSPSQHSVCGAGLSQLVLRPVLALGSICESGFRFCTRGRVGARSGTTLKTTKRVLAFSPCMHAIKTVVGLEARVNVVVYIFR